jgi:hypothetical protein
MNSGKEMCQYNMLICQLPHIMHKMTLHLQRKSEIEINIMMR